MPVTTSWTDPSAGGSLDLTNGAIVSETTFDAIASNFLHLAGADGKVVQIKWVIQSPTAGTTTTSASAVAISPFTTAAMTTLAGSLVVVWAWLSLSGSSVANPIIYVQQDANGYVGVARSTVFTAGSIISLAGATTFAPVAGSHTFNLGWSIGTGTATADTGMASGLLAVEYRTS